MERKGEKEGEGGGVKWAHGRPQICQLKLRVTDVNKDLYPFYIW